MLSLATLAFAGLASLTPASPAQSLTTTATAFASTYDQAACDPSDSGECGQELDAPVAQQSLPLAIPAVLDCNDGRLGSLMQEMIGSCDMPRPELMPHALVVRSANARGARLSASAGGARALPCSTAPPRLDDTPPLFAGYVPQLAAPTAIMLTFAARELVARDPAARLDRPPQAS